MDEQKILDIIGQRLKQARKNANLTQAELAEMVDLSTNFIGMIERGERNTKFINMFKLIYALDNKLEKFFKDL